jgi:hypothetical protein
MMPFADLFENCIAFMMEWTLAFWLIVIFTTLLTAVLATPILSFLITTRRIPFITFWDSVWDRILPYMEKGAVVVFVSFCFAAAGSYLDKQFHTTSTFSGLSSILGIYTGIRFWQLF